jgi:hypothetical protein
MERYARIASAVAVFGLSSAVPALAQSMTGTPTVENGGLIPGYLIVWLLPVAAIISVAAFYVTDRKLRSR